MSTQSLSDLTVKYFQQKGYRTEKSGELEGTSGVPYAFDLLIAKGDRKSLVKIFDWNRTVGINMVINLDKASEDVGFPNPIIIAGKFSGHVKAYANRRGVTLITKQEITRWVR